MRTTLRYCLYAVLLVAVLVAVRNLFFSNAAAETAAPAYSAQNNMKTTGEYPMTNDKGIAEQTKEGAVKAWDKTKEVTADAADATKEGAVKAWDKTKEVTSDAADATKEGAVKAWDKTKEVTADAADATKEGAVKAWDKTKEVTADAVDAVKD